MLNVKINPIVLMLILKCTCMKHAKNNGGETFRAEYFGVHDKGHKLSLTFKTSMGFGHAARSLSNTCCYWCLFVTFTPNPTPLECLAYSCV